MKLFISLLALTFLLVACQSSSNYDNQKRIATAQVDIFRDGAKPQVKYREIGMIADEGGKAEQPSIEGKMIRKAKNMGGNAIIFLPQEESGDDIKPFFAGITKTFTFKALVVAYE